MYNEKELYLSPQMEVYEIKVEKGFAASSAPGSTINNWGSGTGW